MGNFVSVYLDEPEKLAAVVSSKDHAMIEAIVAANPHRLDKEKIGRNLARLVDGDFSPGEAPDGPDIIYAFRALCEAVAAEKTTVEIYLDEDREIPQGLAACDPRLGDRRGWAGFRRG
jgi:hypothetical protein